jgi:hypothetical protein
LGSRDVGWVGRDNVKWGPSGEHLNEFRGITDIGAQRDEDILRSSGRWSRRGWINKRSESEGL